MIVTQIEPVNKKKSKIYIDGQLAFALYKGELSRYRIKTDAEISEDVYEMIINTVLKKRAKLYCMNLLQSMDRTEMQLVRKLKEKWYPQEVAECAIQYVKSYGYIDDAGYASRYIDFKKKSKSRQQITMELLQKGIAKATINEVYEAKEPVDETAMIKHWIEKKKIDIETAEVKEKHKLYMFLIRKGFSPRDISKVIKGMETDTFA